MLKGGKILMTTDGDSFTTVDCADDLSIAGNNAHARSVQHAPNAPGGGIVDDGLVGQLHIRRHAPGHRHTQDTALYEPRPLACFVDGVLKGDLIFAVEGLRDGAGGRDKRAQAVVAEIGAIG